MDLTEGQKVELFLNVETALGYSVVINQEYEGLLYRNEIFKDVEEGMKVEGYIKKIREDGKIDVSLQPQGFRNVIDTDVEKLLQKLQNTKEGYILLTDKSSPEAIKFQLQMSKKAFKRALGSLYKQRKVTILEDRIQLFHKQ